MRFFIAVLLAIFCGNNVFAWGDKGHRIIALIAWEQLSPPARKQIDTLLRGDDSGLTATDFVSESVWADVYRDSDRTGNKIRYEQTRRWHYINLNLTQPDFNKACYGSARLKPQQAASEGPANACITDKVEQFSAELMSPRTPLKERRLALQFLIHLVGDLHQPLHVGNNDDAGGNEVQVSTKGFKRGSLHRYWDSAVIYKLGRKPETIARKLLAQTDDDQRRRWQAGSPRDWTLETLQVARDITYAKLPSNAKLPPKNSTDIHILDEHYVESAKHATAQQLIKAGTRLAKLLNTAFLSPSASQSGH